MDIIGFVTDYAIPFIVVLGVLVFVHELGHYWVARRCGVRVEAFSIGFGPEIFGWTAKSGTRWKVSALPLGGYVKMFGDADVTSRPASGAQAAAGQEGEETGDWAGGQTRPLTPEERDVSFHHKPLGQRAAIVAAGPMANFLFAIVALGILFATAGQQTTPPVVGGVLEDSAAAEAGLQAGDRIVAINGRQIDRFEEIQRFVQLNLDSPLTVQVQRDGTTERLDVRPQIVTITDNFGNELQIARIGIQAGGTEMVRHDPLTASWRAVEETASLTWGTMRYVGQMIAGSRSTDELGGPIMIGEMSGRVADYGLVAMVTFMALLSINLGLINLFPVPMLDGGHLLFYAIEAVRGRPLGERAQEYGFRIGLALVLSLMLFVTFNDLSRLNVF
jgi:regulator of sigma E protease